MKKYVLLSSASIIIIILIFTANLISQRQPDIIKSFNSSIEFEKKTDYKKAIDELTKIYEANKNSYLLNLRLGWLYYSNADYNNSLKYYNVAQSININSVEPLIGLTYPHAALKMWDKLSSDYLDILKIDSNNYTANLRYGQIILNKADYKDAKTYLEKAYNQYPGLYDPNLSLGWTYYYLGSYAKAKELLTAALMLSPGDKLAQQGLDLVK